MKNIGPKAQNYNRKKTHTKKNIKLKKLKKTKLNTSIDSQSKRKSQNELQLLGS
jgi:hypothetical protein